MNATKRAQRSIVVACLMLAASTPAAAQWLTHRSAGVPRTADGRPNLQAPTPRMADGKPDFSGIWDVEHNRPCPPEACNDLPVPQEFVNIGWSLKGGLPYQPWAAALAKQRTEDNRKNDPNSFCLPTGIVRMHTTPLLRKIVQVPGLMVILNERNASYRQIFTDGRALPIDPQPSWVGYSTGKWEGDTLVVQTSGFVDGLWLDANGSPLTPAGKITEKFRRINFGRLEIELTVDDPKAYTSTWTVKLNELLMPDTELLDAICLENEKDTRHLVGR